MYGHQGENYRCINYYRICEIKVDEDQYQTQVVNKHHYAKVFKEKDKVIMFIHKEIFLMRSYNKLQQKKYGNYTLPKNISNNTYIINLHDNMSIFRTINVVYHFYDDQSLYPKLGYPSQVFYK